jgi:hypothetical protein
MEFTIGARASCSDGHCGEVKRLVFDRATETVTHLVIQHGHRPEAGRLGPARLAETRDGEIRLRCTLAEFDKFDHAEEREVADAADQHVGTADLPFTRSTASCNIRATCTDDTDHCTDSTRCAGIIRRVVPRTVPRRKQAEFDDRNPA